MPIYVFYGDETYLLQREIRQVRERVVSPAFAALTHKTLKDPEVLELCEAVGAVSMGLVGETLIEVQDFAYLCQAAGDAEAQLEDLKALLQTLDAGKHLLFVSAKLDRKIKFPKWLCALPGVTLRECKKLEFWKTDEAVERLLADARQQGISLQPDAANLLVETHGVAMQVLVNEIQKLAVYAANRAITPDDVRTLSNHNENTFQMLGDWVHRRNRAIVFHTLDEILLRQHSMQLFALIQTYLNNAYRLRLWQQLGIPQATMAERTKKHPFKVKKDLEEFAAVPLERLSTLKEKALNLEWRAKTGQLNDRLALEVLLSA